MHLILGLNYEYRSRYGAKGLLYFVYWSAAGQGGEFSRGSGIMSPTGKLRGNDSYPSPGFQAHYRRTAHYEQARRLNSIVLNYGRFLVNATSTGVYRIHADPKATQQPWQPSIDLTGCAIAGMISPAGAPSGYPTGVQVSPLRVGNGVLIGQFLLHDGRIALLVNNHNL